MRKAVEDPRPDRTNVPSSLNYDGYDEYGYIQRVNAQCSMYPEKAKITCSLEAERNYKARDQKKSDYTGLTEF